MRRTLVLNVVGLTPKLLGPHTPCLNALIADGAMRPLSAVTPAVTCSAQATYVTGTTPSQHGVVGNGWFFRELATVWFWRQANALVQGPKIWDVARTLDDDFTCAKLFWWYNMYASVDWAVTPRPMYPADGRKIPDVHCHPEPLRAELTQKLGAFPLFKFWGPATDLSSSRWITDAALHVWETRKPTLSLVYLPHLDYNLQRLGPSHADIARDVAQVDALCGELIAQAQADDATVIVLSEYGITEVDTPIHINRALREAGLIAVRDELGLEVLDAGASAAFAVADHQLAHVYVRDPAQVPQVHALLEALPGVETVLDGEGKVARGLDHARSGELIAIARANAWFTYYYWLDDRKAPDFARTVDIHRKPGYDPVELFLNTSKAGVAWRLAKKLMGFRTLMDVIGLDATLVKGSHGRPTDDPDEGPLLIASDAALLGDGPVAATAVKTHVLRAIFGD